MLSSATQQALVQNASSGFFEKKWMSLARSYRIVRRMGITLLAAPQQWNILAIMKVEQFLSRLRASNVYTGQIVHAERIPAREARFDSADPPPTERFARILAREGIERLYTHQVLSIQNVRARSSARYRRSNRVGPVLSLGSVMYEVVTGHPPFPGDHDAAILYRIVNEEPAPLSRHRPSLPSGLQGVIERILQKKASERYSSMADLLHDLRAIQAGVATSRGTQGRRKIGARIGVVAAIVLVAIGGYLAYQRFWPTLKHPAAMFRDKTLVVAVTPFWGQNAEEVEEGRVVQALIERQLFAELGGEQDVKILGRKEVTDIPRSHDDAKAIGSGLGATVVLWGEVLVPRWKYNPI